MASATGFETNGKDLNQIFAPLGVNGIDYGGLGDYTVEESWIVFNGITINNTGGNISTTANKGFKINYAGLYRLNITLNFGNAKEQSQSVVFILSNSSSAPGSYDFVPSPTMSQIYAINCSGANGNDNVTNNLNNINLGNCLSINELAKAKFSENPYFFSFTMQKIGDGSASSRSNFFTLDITFTATAGQSIYPYIRCRQETGPDPRADMQNSTWTFIKLNDIPS